MKRKVSLIGPSTLMVSLPSKWVKDNNVRKGDEIDVALKEGSLIISAGSTGSDIKKVELEKHEIGPFTDNLLPYLYRKGYDEIRIVANLDEVFGILQRKMEDLLGFEIISKTPTSLTIKNIAEPRREDFDVMLRRTFLLLLEMMENAHASIAAKDYHKLGEISLLEKANNKYTNFCKRMIARIGQQLGESPSLMYVIVRDLEEIADEIRNICLLLFRSEKLLLSKESIALLKDTAALMREFYELFYKFEAIKAEKFHDDRNLLIDKSEKLLLDSKNKETAFLHHLSIAINKIANLYGPYYTMHV